MRQTSRAVRYQFAEASWDAVARQLVVRGDLRKLPWRAAECLQMLIEAQGSPVTREDFVEKVWGGALIEESNLGHAIASLRKALDPAPSGNSYIETVAKVGYRLAVPVEEFVEPAKAMAAGRTRDWRVRVGAAAMLLAALAAMGLWWKQNERRERAELLAMEAFSVLRKGRPADGAAARVMIDTATQLYPELPLALAAHAEISARYGKPPFQEALELARRAVAADPACRECRAVLGYVLMTRAWNWEEAGKQLRSVANAEKAPTQWRIWYAQWLLVAGSLEEAENQARKVIGTEPGQPQGHSLLASVLFLKRQLPEAERAAATALTLDGRHVTGHQWMQRICMATNRDEEALEFRYGAVKAWDNAMEAHHREFHERLLRLLKTEGREAVVAALLEEVSQGPAIEATRYHRAVFQAWIGKYEEALVELEAGAVSRPFHMIYTARDPAFEPLRENPRFRAVVEKLGLRIT